ncbi:MAG: hypothetical protein Q9227_006470 [Pyrenula ochraceoflavens]
MPPTSRLPPSNRPIVISGPSGTGKSTLLNRLFTALYPTSAGEQNGREYHFVTRDAFTSLKDSDGFIETAVFGGNMYGTSKKAVEDVMAGRGGKPAGDKSAQSAAAAEEEGPKQRTCVLDIEMEGVKQVLASDLAPPSMEILEQRLRGRGTDKEEDIQKRLTQASVEIEFARSAGEKIIRNDELDRAYGELEGWIFEEGGGGM